MLMFCWYFYAKTFFYLLIICMCIWIYWPAQHFYPIQLVRLYYIVWNSEIHDQSQQIVFYISLFSCPCMFKRHIYMWEKSTDTQHRFNEWKNIFAHTSCEFSPFFVIVCLLFTLNEYWRYINTLYTPRMFFECRLFWTFWTSVMMWGDKIISKKWYKIHSDEAMIVQSLS